MCLVDDLLKAIGHQEYKRRKVSDSEIITTAIVSTPHFGGHLEKAKGFMKMTGLSPAMLDKSRFCRRFYSLNSLLYSLFFQMTQYLEDFSGARDYKIDSFPVAGCDT